MPNNRLFLDNWYVSHEDHTYAEDLVKILNKYKPKKYKKLLAGLNMIFKQASKDIKNWKINLG